MQIGYSVNEWTLVDIVTSTSKQGWKRVKYIIQCSCGKQREVDPWDFKNLVASGPFKTLGTCCRKCSEKSYWENKNSFQMSNLIYNDYRQQASRRGYKFELSKEEAFNLFTSNCHFCGSKPENTKTHTRNKEVTFSYQGIDRVDPSKDYTADNTIPCCKHCNYAKREMSYLEFCNWINKVYNFRVQRLFRKEVEPSGSKQKPSYN